jgi:hypothetical protein
MLKTVRAIVREGKIELLEELHLSEGTKVLVTILSEDDEGQFWLQVSNQTLADVWDNDEDDIYAELLQE